jgi:hypothetical protein
MSWIKIDKDLIDDPRLTQAAIKLVKANETLCVTNALPFYLSALRGALVTLWVYADTHIRDDNTLEFDSQALNAIVGIEGFASVLPREWITELDNGYIQLPGYREKNGVVARERRANNAKARQAAYRIRRSNAQHNGSVTRDSLIAKCRDLDLDLDKKRKIPKEKKVPREAFDVTQFAGLDTKAWADWCAYRVAIKKPLRPASMSAAARKLAAMGPRQRAAVDESIANGYQGLFEPKSNGKHPPAAAPDHSAEWAEAKARGQAIGFRAPYPLESVGAYMTQVKFSENHVSKSVLRRIQAS